MPTVSLAFDRVVVKFGDAVHVSFYRSKLLGYQTWKYGDKNYFIEYTLEGGDILCEYDDEQKWRAVIAGLEQVL